MFVFMIETISVFNHIFISERQIVKRKMHLFLFILTARSIQTSFIFTLHRVSLASVFTACSLKGGET